MEKILVAKSYQNSEFIGNVYVSNGKQYIKIRTKSGGEKAVRVYTEKEYNKMYGENTSTDSGFKLASQKKVLFKGDYIHLVKGDTYAYKDWLKSKGATFRQNFSWMFQADVPLPDEMPFGLELVKLPWDAVAANEERLMSDDKVKEVVEKYLYTPDGIVKGGYVGVPTQRIEERVYVDGITAFDGYYGTSYCVRLRTIKEDYLIVWMTSSATVVNWQNGDELLIRATVSEQKEYRGECETIVKRVKDMGNK